MIYFTLFRCYFAWHYTAGLFGCLRLLADFLWFIYHFFSVPVIVPTLFTPWRRLGEAYRGGFDPGRVFETFIVNTLMRLFGFVIRLIFLLVALAAILVTFFFGLLATMIFLFAPVIILGSFIIGFYLLFLI